MATIKRKYQSVKYGINASIGPIDESMSSKKMSASKRPLWAELLTQAVAIGGLIVSLRICMQYLDPYREQREQAKKRALFLKKTLGRSLELNEFEQVSVAAHSPQPTAHNHACHAY